MLPLTIPAPRMPKERDRAPLSTEISPGGVDLHPFERARNQSPDDDATRAPSHNPQVATFNERLAIGQRLSGRYRIERELGEGGMGVVYLAVDEQIAGETFAVKVLKEAPHPTTLALLRQEVHQTRRLSHPNIVDVHSVNVDGSRLYVLMEYLEGKSLNTLLHEEFGRGMTLSRAWPIIEDAGAALGYAHDHNVIHSDLKPANIFVTSSDKAKLLDFGIARVSRGPLLNKQSGPCALTPEYASCEMLEGQEADPRDDVYSFACVIYEMLSGKRPFGDRTALEARDSGARAPPLKGLSKRQNAALHKALAFSREARTASVETLLDGLVAEPKPGIRLFAGAIIVFAAAVGLSYWAVDKLRTPSVSVTAPVAAFSPPPHSIAVLPLVNIGDKAQDYFSDGLTEELLDSLSRINELQVAARTSSFSFQEKHPDIATVAHKLNVASVLEGSVRRSGNVIRVTVQLNNALTGFQLWSQSYDRDVGDVLALQTEIAGAVTSVLKVKLLGDVAARIELGGTRNRAAFDAYLQGLKASNMSHDAKDHEAAIAAYAEAIRLDPSYALALAAQSLVLTDYADFYATGSAIHESYERAQTNARLAIARAPALADGYLALARVLESESLDFAQAAKEYQRAMSLAPGNAQVVYEYGRFAVLMGHTDDGFAATRRAEQLDPLNSRAHRLVSLAFRMLHRYEEAVEAAQAALALDANNPGVLTTLGMAYYALGSYQAARDSCERVRPPAGAAGSYFGIQVCLAISYGKLGQPADAQSTLRTLQSWYGDRGAYQYAEIYSQWGNTAEALAWLEKARRLKDSGLAWLKVDQLLDPLRGEPRFRAIQQSLKFPP
jgi:serine/threonine protein kinase/Tfp pilus assembly protein PilF